jgi:hypothetical protein
MLACNLVPTELMKYNEQLTLCSDHNKDSTGSDQLIMISIWCKLDKIPSTSIEPLDAYCSDTIFSSAQA